MIGLVLLYFAGKAFYDLAGRYNKNKWLFAILGVLSYYGGLFFGGVIVAIVYQFVLGEHITESNELFLTLLAIPIGILVAAVFYKLLEITWRKAAKPSSLDGVLDAPMRKDDSEY